jgi:hypothetical protein
MPPTGKSEMKQGLDVLISDEFILIALETLIEKQN